MVASKSLTTVARELGKDPATVYRWWKKGVRGVRLQTFMLGGQRHVAEDALANFFTAITAVSSPDSNSAVAAPSPSPTIDASAELVRRGY